MKILTLLTLLFVGGYAHATERDALAKYCISKDPKINVAGYFGTLIPVEPTVVKAPVAPVQTIQCAGGSCQVQGQTTTTTIYQSGDCANGNCQQQTRRGFRFFR